MASVDCRFDTDLRCIFSVRHPDLEKGNSFNVTEAETGRRFPEIIMDCGCLGDVYFVQQGL